MSIYSHVMLGAKDIESSRRFYDAALGALGIDNMGKAGENAYLYGKAAPEFVVTLPVNGEPACHANGGTLGFVAESRAQVRAFHDAGIANGGTDEGAAGPRPAIPNAYGAYLRDPVGNKICAFCYAEGE